MPSLSPGSEYGSAPSNPRQTGRSEEHTSELQSRLHLVCRLLLEKKKIRRLRPPGDEERGCERRRGHAHARGRHTEGSRGAVVRPHAGGRRRGSPEPYRPREQGPG